MKKFNVRTVMHYSYAGDLVAEVSISEAGQISAELLASGFSYSYGTSSKVFYRRDFYSNEP